MIPVRRDSEWFGKFEIRLSFFVPKGTYPDAIQYLGLPGTIICNRVDIVPWTTYRLDLT